MDKYWADNRHKGNFAPASAIKYFTLCRYVVSIPLADTAKYDLVVERDGDIKRVQCKYTGSKTKYSAYQVPLFVCGGNKTAGSKRWLYKRTDFDLLYVLCENGREYVIPCSEIPEGQVALVLGKPGLWAKWEEYVVTSSGKVSKSG